MNEKTEHLRATLRELEMELAQMDSLDAESRALLEEASREIQEVLAGRERAAGLGPTDAGGPGQVEAERAAEVPSAAAGSAEPETTPVRSRLSEAIERFGSDHPTLSGVLGRLVDTLGQMGI